MCDVIGEQLLSQLVGNRVGEVTVKRVLLTGAAGFIGSVIGRNLTEQGVEVVGVDALIPQAHGECDEVAGVHRFDVRNADAWSELLHGVDVVCHQAALVGAGVQVSDLPAYAAHNDLGTATLLAAMYQSGVTSLVLASSMVVYGEGRYECPEHGEQRPGPRDQRLLDSGRFDHMCRRCGRSLEWGLVTESAPHEPRSAYAASKLAQENYASAWSREGGGSVVALRYHNVYGPGMPRNTPYSGVAAMFRSSLETGEAPAVFEDGMQTRDFVHVDDVSRANVAALDAADTHGSGFEAYNVCSGHPITIAQVAELVASGASAPQQPVITGKYRLGDVRHVVASPQRAYEELGFHAEVDPHDGLPEFATAPLRS